MNIEDQPLFRFSKVVENTLLHPCPRCGGASVEIYNVLAPFVGPTGIRRCLDIECDWFFDPSMPWMDEGCGEL